LEKRALDWLQALRGIAALLVVLTHARYFLHGTPSESLAEALLRPGAMGVDLFFLVSGFIMVYTTTDSDGSLRYATTFLIKRFARIWPVYVVVALLGVLIEKGPSWFLAQDHLVAMAKSLLFLPVDTAKPPYYDLPFAIGWTLNFEAYFYLVFSVAMLLGRLRWIAFFGWLSLTLIALPLAKTGLVSLDVQTDYGFHLGYLNQMTNPIIWDFAAGVIVGHVYRSRVTFSGGLVATNTAFLAVVAAIWGIYSGIVDFHGMAKWGAPAALAVLTLAVVSKGRVLHVPRVLMWLGDISFSLYLVHIIGLGVTTSILKAIGLEPLTHTWWHIFLTASISLSLASLSHRLLERGLSEQVRNWTLAKLGRHDHSERLDAQATR